MFEFSVPTTPSSRASPSAVRPTDITIRRVRRQWTDGLRREGLTTTEILSWWPIRWRRGKRNWRTRSECQILREKSAKILSKLIPIQKRGATVYSSELCWRAEVRPAAGGPKILTKLAKNERFWSKNYRDLVPFFFPICHFCAILYRIWFSSNFG